MSQREESRLPMIFYKMIDNFQNDEWLKFIRYLGLMENELQSILGRRDIQFSEKKYQSLNRWKMYLSGNPSDNDVEQILKQTSDEISRGCTNNHHFSEHLEPGRERAKAIYSFIDKFAGNDTWWNKLLNVNLPPAESARIKQNYHDDDLECKYQLTLRILRRWDLGKTVLSLPNDLEGLYQSVLNAFRDIPRSDPNPQPVYTEERNNRTFQG